MNIAKEFDRLKAVEWGELDIKESGSWPTMLQLICAVVLLALTFAGMYWYLVAPKVEALAGARDHEQQLLNQYRIKASKAAHLPTLQAQVERLDGRLEALMEMLPSDAEIPSLLSSISQAGIANQLRIESIRRRPDVQKTFYIERPFDISVTGDYHRISSFIAALADLPRIVTQHDFSLKPAAEGGLLQLSMAARTYSYEHSSEDNERAEGGQ